MITRFIPSREQLKQSRVLRWLGPRIHDPLLWHINRNAVAKGVAIGAFFGFMVPVAQIPAAAVVSLFMRANLWVAAIATLVSNPFTYGPIYYFAYRLGHHLLPAPVEAIGHMPGNHLTDPTDWLLNSVDWLTGVGRPLVLGMLIMATVSAVLGYFGVLLIWRIKVILKRRRQQLARRMDAQQASNP